MHGCFFLILKRVPENTLKKLFVYCSSNDRAAFVPKMNAAVAISSVGKQGNELDVWAQRGSAKTPRDTRLDNQEIRAVNRDSTSEISSKFRIPATPLPKLPFSESVVFVTQVRFDCCCCCCCCCCCFFVRILAPVIPVKINNRSANRMWDPRATSAHAQRGTPGKLVKVGNPAANNHTWNEWHTLPRLTKKL